MRREFKMNGVKFRCIPLLNAKGWKIQYFSKNKNAWIICSSLGACPTLKSCREYIFERFLKYYQDTSNLFE